MGPSRLPLIQHQQAPARTSHMAFEDQPEEERHSGPANRNPCFVDIRHKYANVDDAEDAGTLRRIARGGGDAE